MRTEKSIIHMEEYCERNLSAMIYSHVVIYLVMIFLFPTSQAILYIH